MELKLTYIKKTICIIFKVKKNIIFIIKKRKKKIIN